jgi:hypothetical protein
VEVDQQIAKVSNHLDSICLSLSEIDQRLGEGQKAQKTFVTQVEEERKKKMARRLIKKAEALIEACNNYLALTNRNLQLRNLTDQNHFFSLN